MTDLIFDMKKGDTHNPLQLLLKHGTSSSSSVVDLTSDTAKFYMRLRGERTNKVDGTAMSITGDSAGELEYQWKTADVDTAGTYEGEVVVTYDDDSEETFPENSDKIVIVIHKSYD